MMSKETRMAIHIAALKADWEQPGSYKEFTKRALEQEQTLAGSPSTVALADLPAGLEEIVARSKSRHYACLEGPWRPREALGQHDQGCRLASRLRA
jgi:hypothetical protein